MQKMKLNIQLFSVSITVDSISETPVDSTAIQTNETYIDLNFTVSVSGQTHNNEKSAYFTITTTSENEGTQTSAQTKFSIDYNGHKSWNRRLGPFLHNPNGSLSNVSVKIYAKITNTTNTTKTVSVPMATIPRGPHIECSSYTVGRTSATFNVYSSNTTPLAYVVIFYTQYDSYNNIVNQNAVMPGVVSGTVSTGDVLQANLRTEFLLSGYSIDIIESDNSISLPRSGEPTIYTYPNPIDVSYLTFDTTSATANNSIEKDTCNVGILANLIYGTAYGNAITDLTDLTYRVYDTNGTQIASGSRTYQNYTQPFYVYGLQPRTFYRITVQTTVVGGAHNNPIYETWYYTDPRPIKVYVRYNNSWKKGLLYIYNSSTGLWTLSWVSYIYKNGQWKESIR